MPYQTPTTPTPKKVARCHGLRSVIKSKYDKQDSKKEAVGVFLRLRPSNSSSQSVIQVNNQQVQNISPDGQKAFSYKFTHVFGGKATQKDIFERVTQPVVEELVRDAKNGLIFTYGVTFSGKTHTMVGKPSDPGLIFRTVDFIFNSIKNQQLEKGNIESNGLNGFSVRLYPTFLDAKADGSNKFQSKWQERKKELGRVGVDPTTFYAVFISLIELYNKQVFDLFEDRPKDLNPDKYRKSHEIRQDSKGVSYVANAVEKEVKTADETIDLFFEGLSRRTVAKTALNSESSRSHCVFNIKLVRIEKSYDDKLDESTLKASQLCLVDLAGSERAKRSHATGGTLQEAGNINNSLGALRKCIKALRDRDQNGNPQYREYSLTKLFKSYFEGHGTVRMVLCINPEPKEFQENNFAMDFGVMTQDVAIDYASPPKLLKRSMNTLQDCAAMYEFLSENHQPLIELTANTSEDKILSDYIDQIKRRKDKRRRIPESIIAAQGEVRQNILAASSENAALRQQNEEVKADMMSRVEKIDDLENALSSQEKSREVKNDRIRSLEREIKSLNLKLKDKDRVIDELHNNKNKSIFRAHKKIELEREQLMRNIDQLLLLESDRAEARRRLEQWKKTVNARSTERFDDWINTAPSAPQIEPVESPLNIHDNNVESDTTESHTPQTTTTTSSEQMTTASNSPTRLLVGSPTNGIPVVNPRHNRSLSTGSLQWIYHKPAGTVDTGTVFKPKIKNRKSVKVLRSSDILRKDAAGYSVVHQDADTNGDIETSVYKGHIISTVCGGAQVILNDVEKMKQVSPARKRAASDALCN